MAEDAITQAIFDSISGIDDGGNDDNTEISDPVSEGTAGDAGSETHTQTEAASAEGANGESAASRATVAEVEDKLAKELGIDPKRKNNRIPYPDVQRITSTRERKIAEKVAQLFGLEGDDLKNVKYDDLDALFEKHYKSKLKTYDEELGSLRESHQVRTSVEQLIKENPEEYLQMLAMQVPYFRKFVMGQEQNDTTSRKPQATTVEDTIDDKMPEPDVEWQDGSRTYSIEGFNKRLAYERKLAAQEHKKEIAELKKSISPLIDREKAQAVKIASEQKIAAMLERNRKLPGWTDNEAEILELFKKDKSLSVHDAYTLVTSKKYNERIAKLEADIKASRQAGREDAIKEVNTAKPDTSVAVRESVKDGGGETGVDPITATIRKAIAHIK